MIVNEDYKFRDDLVKEENETVPIELLTGPFKGVILRYTRVAVQEGIENAKLKFEYDILKMPGDFSQPGLRKNKVFEQTIGLILNAMILEVVDSNEHGTGDTQKSYSE